MPILNLHEFTIQMPLLPFWLTVMCTVRYSIVFCRIKAILTAFYVHFGYVSAPSLTRRTKMCYKLFHLWSHLHRQRWRPFLMWMVLHQELIGWCLVANSTWCIAFSIERNITKHSSFREVKQEHLDYTWLNMSVCVSCGLNFQMLLQYILH